MPSSSPGVLPGSSRSTFGFFQREENSQVAAPNASKVATQRALCMLGEGPRLVAPQDSSEASPGVCWPLLETGEFPESKPRLLQGSYPKSFVNVRGRSITGSSPGLLPEISRNILVSSGDSGIPR